VAEEQAIDLTRALGRNGDLEVRVDAGEADALDQVQVAVDLVDAVRSGAQLRRERGSTELLRFPGAQRDAGEIADIGRNVGCLAEGGEDDGGVE
jgi:hypothetical protein